MSPSERATGNIYDLGYREYAGERLGRRHAVTSLFLYSLRAAFGLGRRTTAKIIPFALAAIAYVPAAIALGVAALVSEDIELWSHEGYYATIQITLMLFAAAVGPELVSRDQRTRVLSLYFSRALYRRDYAAAKTLAFVAAMLILTLGPQTLLFFGRGLASDSLPDYISDSGGDVIPIVVTAIVLSTMAACQGVAIASQTGRRAYATVSILAAFMLTGILADILSETSGTGVARIGALVSPFDVAEGVTFWIFNEPVDVGSTVDRANLAGWVWGGAALTHILVSAGIIYRRYERIPA